jgi:hypothetical protein
VFVLWEGRKTPDEVPIIGISHLSHPESQRALCEFAAFRNLMPRR